MYPGEARPWMRSSAAIAENAVPTRIVRASFRRTPTSVSASEATVARSALSVTDQKWNPLERWTWSRP